MLLLNMFGAFFVVVVLLPGFKEADGERVKSRRFGAATLYFTSYIEAAISIK